MKFANITLLIAVLVSTFGLVSCGGGSSSGGAQSKDLSSCVVETRVDVPSVLPGISDTEYTWQNNCGTTVNLTIATLASIESTISLVAGAEHTMSVSLFFYRYVACRPPYVGVDGNAELATIQLACN